MTEPTGVLQRGSGRIPGDIYLPAEAARLHWGRSPCAADAPVLEVDPGALVTIDTLSHEGLLEDQGSDPVAFFGRHGVAERDVLDDAIELARTRRRDAGDGPHVLTGPVAVRGARPGDVLAIDVVELAPRVPYGVISNRHGRGALPGEFPRGGETVSVFASVEPDGRRASIARRAGAVRDASFPVAPFLGTMGVAVAGQERPNSIPPGRHGGNLDINLLVPGSTLHLAVQVDGGLAYVGDPHFAQGDGEVALTALEASLRATLRFRLLPAADPLAAFVVEHGPLVETPACWVPTGLDADLREALKACVRASIGFLERFAGMDAEHAYAYLSAATDFDISQVVDLVCGVHARIPKDVVPGG